MEAPSGIYCGEVGFTSNIGRAICPIVPPYFLVLESTFSKRNKNEAEPWVITSFNYYCISTMTYYVRSHIVSFNADKLYLS